MLNKVQIIGNLGKDVDLRRTPSGVAVGAMSVAATSKWKTKDGQAQEHTEWFRVCTYGRTAENCAEYLAKGSKVYVEGELRTREYQDRSGETKRITELIARDVKFLDGARRDGGQQSAGNQGGGGDPLPPDDDIPF